VSGRKFHRPFMDLGAMRFFKDVELEKAFFSATLDWETGINGRLYLDLVGKVTNSSSGY
jgi:hypothetical protein